MPRVSDGKIMQKLLAASTANGSKAPEISGPNPAQYGVYGSGYAGAMQSQAGDPHYGAFYMSHLNTKANDEAARYEQLLAETQAAQLRAQQAANSQEMNMALLEKAPEAMFTGTYGAIKGADGSTSGWQVDPAYGVAQDALAGDKAQADIYGTKAEALHKAAQTGMVLKPEDYGIFMRGALESPETAPQYVPGMTPADSTTLYGTDQGLTAEQQFSMQELKNLGQLEAVEARIAAGDNKWKAVLNPDDGTVSYVFQGQGAVPSVGEIQGLGNVNPDAAAQTGGVAATQAGDPKLFFSKPNSGRGVRTDPIAGGKRMHKGEDFAKPAGTPIPAEQDGRIIQVGGLRGFGPHANIVEYVDGSRVIYGHNASSLPVGTPVKRGQAVGTVGSKGRSTGPHVHRQVARGPQASPTHVPATNTNKVKVVMQRVQNATPDAKMEVVGNEVHVTNPKTGTVFVLNAEGKRIR